MLHKSVTHIRNFYARFERPISSFSLVGGFVFDAITLTRVDEFWENFWIGAHLLIVAVFIILLNARENSGDDESNPSKIHFWYVNILQFFFGGLLSAYLVFYFRAADISSSWPFILLLGLAFWANETWKRRFVRVGFQIAMLYLSIFAFLIYHIPTALHQVGSKIFIISGIGSLGAMAVFLFIFKKTAGKKYYRHRFFSYGIIISIYLAINCLYFLNLIPPLPVSLRDAGIYHSISKSADGNYQVEAEDSGWKQYVVFYQDIHLRANDFLVAYSAIFSPQNLNTDVVHTWQYYDSLTGKWQTESIIKLPVAGGRDGGFRTYSIYGGLQSGRWRVVVTTLDGLVIGKVKFNVIVSETDPTTVTKILR
jgi:hypothetical protein